MDQEADRGDDEQHDRGELVGIEVDVDVEIAGRDPAEQVLLERLDIGVDVEQHEHREQPRGEDGRRGHPVGVLPDHGPSEQDVDDECRQRQERDQEQVIGHQRSALRCESRSRGVEE